MQGQAFPVKTLLLKLSYGKTSKTKFWGLSLDSRVKWPNDNLGPRFNNFGKAEVKFRQLDLRLLVVGELNIACHGVVSELEKEARLKLLGDIVFYAVHYQWPALLKFHTAMLSGIEKGAAGWGYDYNRLQQHVLMPFPLAKFGGGWKVRKVSWLASGANVGGKHDQSVVYWGEYRHDSYILHDNHGGRFFAQSVLFQHICSTCWKQLKTCAYHLASSTECPLSPWVGARKGGLNRQGQLSLDSGWCLSENGIKRDCEELIMLHERVKRTGFPNFQIEKIFIRSKWNIDYMKRQLAGYHEQTVVTLCEYAWLIGFTDGENLELELLRNHSGAREFPDQMIRCWSSSKQTHFGRRMVVSLLNTTEKRDRCEQ